MPLPILSFEYGFSTFTATLPTVDEFSKLSDDEKAKMFTLTFGIMGQTVTKANAAFQDGTWQVISHGIFVYGNTAVVTFLIRRQSESNRSRS